MKARFQGWAEVFPSASWDWPCPNPAHQRGLFLQPLRLDPSLPFLRRLKRLPEVAWLLERKLSGRERLFIQIDSRSKNIPRPRWALQLIKSHTELTNLFRTTGKIADLGRIDLAYAQTVKEHPHFHRDYVAEEYLYPCPSFILILKGIDKEQTTKPIGVFQHQKRTV